MPIYSIQGPDGRSFDLEGDSPPTEQELEQVFASLPSSQRQLKPSTQETLSENERLAQQFIDQEQRGPVQRALDIVAIPFQIGGQLLGAAKGGIQGPADIAGSRTGEQGLAGTLATLLAPGATSQGQAALGDIAQSAVEGGGRLAFDLANMARQGAEKVQQQGLVRTALGLTGPGMIAQALTPRTPSAEEVQTAIANQLAGRAFEEERAKADMAQQAGVNIGQAQPQLAEAVATFAQPESILGLGAARVGLGAAARSPIVRGIGAAAETVGDITKGAVEATVKPFVPTSIIDDTVNALDPRRNALNPKATVQAMKSAKRSVEAVVDQIPSIEQASGFSFDTAQGAADVSRFAKQNVWSKIENAIQTPVEVDLTPVGEEYIKLSNNKAIQRLFPNAKAALQVEADKFLGQKVQASTAEEMNQILNANNEALFQKTGIDRAKALNADPLLKAHFGASNKLRDVLNSAIESTGQEFSSLKKEYGAWADINELAQRQAVRQAKLEGNLSIYEGLGLLGALSAESPLRAARTYFAGKVAKVAGSPDAKFASAKRAIAREVPVQPITTVAPPIPQAAVVPTLSEELQRIISTLPAEVQANAPLAQRIAEQIQSGTVR